MITQFKIFEYKYYNMKCNPFKLKIGDVVIADINTAHESIVKILDLTPLESISTVCPFDIEDTENTINFWKISTSRLTPISK